MSVIVCGYGEIHLKGANRGFFLRKLVSNIKRVLPATVKVVLNDARVIVTNYEDEQMVIDRLSNVFGLTSIKVCQQLSYQTPDDILSVVSTLKIAGTFKVEVNRANKAFPIKSPAFAAQCGDVILAHNTNAQVDVRTPQTVIQIDIRNQGVAFIATGAIAGLGGLPVGVSGRAICLISGGIDSPVAAFLAMKRGLAVDFIHFTTPPYTSDLALEKVETLCQQVNLYGGDSKLFVVPFTEIGAAIQKHCHDAYVITIMRRFMIAMAEKVGLEHGADCIITGENLAQVASQTIQGITSNNFVATRLPILRPLICYDKEEIINLAKQIKTYTTSILPYEDCCTVFVPTHPATKPSLANVLAEEKKLDFDTLLNNSYYKIVCKPLPNTCVPSLSKPLI